MFKLPPVDIKRLFISLVGDSVLDLGAKHHLRAVHEVVHHVFQLWHQGFPVNDVEVDLSIRRDLDSNVTLDVVDETSEVNLVVEHPLFLIDQGIIDHLEEKNLAAAPHY